MTNAYDQMRTALVEAERFDDAARSNANALARLLIRPGVLQQADATQLRRLKRALRRFDMNTGGWKP